jgi:cellulose biosynthesis protein BcsQ
MMAGRHTGAPDRERALSRVIAVSNEKGGVGKTSIVANVGGQLAAAGYPTLLIDLNRQANLSDDLGVREVPENDQGRGLFDAITMRGRYELPVLSSVRPNLDLALGGEELERLLTWLVIEKMHYSEASGPHPLLALADALVPIAERYDVILIDCPPEAFNITDLILAAARWILMPTKSDLGGERGMNLVSKRFAAAKQLNPHLRLLGAVLFDTGTTSTAIHKEVGIALSAAFGGTSPLFTSKIRHAERTAFETRGRGKLAHELEAEAANQPAWWEALRSGESVGPRIPRTAASVAADYRELAYELLTVLSAAEATA